MTTTSFKTVSQYLESLPEERRTALQQIRTVILDHLPKGYQEGFQFGILSYYVPISLYPNGYLNDKKTGLPYLSLASQKNYMSLYLMCVYGDKKLAEWFETEYKKTGKKLDMGKSCLRFKKVEDLPLELIGEVISKVSVDDFIAQYETSRGKR
jgi:hypothetical protein